jgi:hypothetical protein
VGPTDEHRRAATDPSTPARTLADLAAEFPELRGDIAANPAAYEALRQWIVDQASTPGSPGPASAQSSPEPAAKEAGPTASRRPFASRRRLALILAGSGAAAIVILVVVLILAGSARPAVVASPTPSRTAASSPTPTVAPVPTRFQLPEPERWHVYGEALYRVVDESHVEFFLPGEGVVTKNVPDFRGLVDAEVTVYSDAVFTGPVDDLRFVAAAVRRTPASGLDPESYAAVLLSTASGTPGLHEVQLWPVNPPAASRFELAPTSERAVVAVTQVGDLTLEGDRVTGVEVDSGQVLWSYAGAETDDTAMMIETAVVYVHRDEPGHFSTRGCWDALGVEIATGDILWTGDLDPCTYWSGGTEDYIAANGQGGQYHLYDRVTGTPLLGWGIEGAYNGNILFDPIGRFGVGVGYTEQRDVLRVFDTTSGDVVLSFAPDEVDELGLRVVQIWAGKLYAHTTDQSLVLDARTGDVLADEFTWYPLLAVAGWTLYSDGVVTSDVRS